MTHTCAVLRSKQTGWKNHDVCANVLKVYYMQHFSKSKKIPYRPLTNHLPTTLPWLFLVSKPIFVWWMVMKLYRIGVLHRVGRLNFAELDQQVLHNRRQLHQFHLWKVPQRCFLVNLEIDVKFFAQFSHLIESIFVIFVRFLLRYSICSFLVVL